MDKEFMAFAAIASLLSGGGNEGAMFPSDDAADFANGARYIPGEVTDARRMGLFVLFDAGAHQWQLPDGSWVPKGGSDYANPKGYSRDCIEGTTTDGQPALATSTNNEVVDK